MQSLKGIQLKINQCTVKHVLFELSRKHWNGVTKDRWSL